MGSPPRPHSACLPSQHNDVVLSLVAYNKACFFEGGGGGGGHKEKNLNYSLIRTCGHTSIILL